MHTRSLKWISTTALSVLLFAFAAGCEEKGPAERAGERFDEAMEDIKDTAEDAADEVREATDEVEDELDERF